MKNKKSVEIIHTERFVKIKHKSLKLASIKSQKRLFTIVSGKLSKELCE